jgi:hypothetical protein
MPIPTQKHFLLPATLVPLIWPLERAPTMYVYFPKREQVVPMMKLNVGAPIMPDNLVFLGIFIRHAFQRSLVDIGHVELDKMESNLVLIFTVIRVTLIFSNLFN